MYARAFRQLHNPRHYNGLTNFVQVGNFLVKHLCRRSLVPRRTLKLQRTKENAESIYNEKFHYVPIAVGITNVKYMNNF